jgi:hypothetical protein
MRSAKFLVTVFFITTIASFVRGGDTGSVAGNGDYCSQQGAKCERVSFRASNLHPQHATILELLNGKPLPTRLRNAILRDLKETMVIYSGEKIRVKDLKERYELQLVSRTTEYTYDSDNNLLGTVVREEENQVQVLPDLGIYITPHRYQAGSEDNLWVRAIAEKQSQRVIYFTEFVNDSQMSEDEQIRLVFHEQAHRVEELESVSGERAAEGWAFALFNYLTSDESYQSFKEKLLAFRIYVPHDEFSLPKTRRIGDNMFIGNITITISPSTLLNTFYKEGHYKVAIAPEAFSQYTGLDSDIRWISTACSSKECCDNVDQLLAPVQQGESVIVNLEVIFVEKLVDPNDKTLETYNEIIRIDFENVEEKEYLNSVRDGYTGSAHLEFTTGSTNLRVTPRLASDRLNAQAALKLTETTWKSVAMEHEASKAILSLWPQNPIRNIHVALFKEETSLVLYLERRGPFNNEKALMFEIGPELNSTSVSETLSVIFREFIAEKKGDIWEREKWLVRDPYGFPSDLIANARDIRSHKALYEIISHTPLRARLECLASKLGDVIVEYSKGPQLEWDILVDGDLIGYTDIRILIPIDFDHKNRQALSQFLLEKALVPENYRRQKSLLFAKSRASWNPSRERFHRTNDWNLVWDSYVAGSMYVFHGDLIDALATCQ